MNRLATPEPIMLMIVRPQVAVAAPVANDRCEPCDLALCKADFSAQRSFDKTGTPQCPKSFVGIPTTGTAPKCGKLGRPAPGTSRTSACCASEPTNRRTH